MSLAALAAQAHAVGAVMTEEDVNALDDVGDSAAMMGQTFKGITGHLAGCICSGALNSNHIIK